MLSWSTSSLTGLTTVSIGWGMGTAVCKDYLERMSVSWHSVL